MELTVTPGEGGLLLQWTFPDSTPLASFTLEFEDAQYPFGPSSPKKILDGAMRVYTLNDLAPILYTVRLTPVALNGVTLTDLAVTAQGTPLLGRMTDGQFPRPSTVAPDNSLHEGAPETSDSGIPLLPLWAVLGPTGLLSGRYLLRRKKRLQETQGFLKRMDRVYHS